MRVTTSKSNNETMVNAARWLPVLVVLVLDATTTVSNALVVPQDGASRRAVLGWLGSASGVVLSQPGWARDDNRPDSLDVDDYLRTGLVANPMGVSGQAGKSRPETGVVLRDGSDVSRDSRTGDVLAEIVVKDTSNDLLPVLASYSSPWPLAKGTVFDVECRDAKSGDGAFLAVTDSVGGESVGDLKDSFFVKQLVKPTGRFSFYGAPTDVKVTKSSVRDNYKILDLSFSTLSQSTQTELPRKARIAATIPSGSNQAIMLVASSSALRWKKGSEKTIDETISSFRATAAPKSSLRVRAKKREGSL